MLGNKNTARLWQILPIAACVAALLSVCVCACVILGETQAVQPQAPQPTQNPNAVAASAPQAPQFRAFDDRLEVLQEGEWSPIAALAQLEQGDPSAITQPAHAAENDMTPPEEDAPQASEEAAAPGEDSAPPKSTAAPPPDAPGGPADADSEESNAYL